MSPQADFTYYGCFNSLPKSGTGGQALPYQQKNGPKGSGLLYKLSDCSAVAISSGVVAFGMQNFTLGDDGLAYGNCFLSDEAGDTDGTLNSEEQINSAVLYGSPDASLNVCGTDGIGQGPVNAVYANTSAIDFFTTESVSQRVREDVIKYTQSLKALNLRFANVMNQLEIAEAESTDVFKASVTAHTNELMVIIKEMMLLKLGLEKTCNDINKKINYKNSEIAYTDQKKTLAELKLQRLYGSDNASAGWLSDTQNLTNIMNIENISLIAVALIFISVYHLFKKAPIQS